MSLQTMIQQANNRSSKGRAKTYVKKSSDSQLLVMMKDAAAKAIDAYRAQVKETGWVVCPGLHEALRELDLLRDVVEKRTR